MLKNVKLRTKLLLVGLVLTVVPLLVLGISTYFQNKNMENVARTESVDLAFADLDHIVEGVYAMCQAQQEVLEGFMQRSLSVAWDIVKSYKGFSFESDLVTWNAMNQYTRNTTTVKLPKMLVGGRWLGQVNDVSKKVPVVDKVQELTHTTCTIFQRINSAGDMLRVATNVIKKDGTRAIGTYIPYINPDGTPNPVISTVLKGQTFTGRAYVVNKWYITTYEPIYDAGNNIVGVLYVGIPQESTNSLRQAIMDVQVGKTGYVYVLDSKGHYVISQNGKRDGELIWGAKDPQGNLFIQEIIQKATGLRPGEYAQQRYPWQNPGDPEPRYKVVRVKYFAPWDWVIGAGSYEEEFLAAPQRIEKMATRTNIMLVVISLLALIGTAVVWYFTSAGISKPVVNMADTIRRVAQEHDLTLEVPVVGGDEIGVMGQEFNTMLGQLRDSFVLVDDAAIDVRANSSEVAKRASNNRERAKNEEKQMAVIQTTVRQMGETAGEVAGFSLKQSEAASMSSANLAKLVDAMEDAAQVSKAQTQDANNAMDRVAEMGETGGKVVATAVEQGEQVVRVTESVNQIAQSVQEMTSAAERANEHGQSVLEAAREGLDSVNATVDGMQAIAESSEQISEIIGVITEIAEQTNLLALNAAIEAARAGAHGKGFAVVADEVGKLAQRSSEAAKEITDLIKNSSARVDEGTRLTDQSQKALKKIAEGGEVNMAAIQEIAQNAKVLDDGTQQVHSLMGTLNELAGQIADMAGQQKERRQVAQSALTKLVEEAQGIAARMTETSDITRTIGDEMQGIVQRTEQMEKLTGVQAKRSQKLIEITVASARGAQRTVEGAGQVVGITEELQNLSVSLADRMAQFKIRSQGYQGNGGSRRQRV